MSSVAAYHSSTALQQVLMSNEDVAMLCHGLSWQCEPHKIARHFNASPGAAAGMHEAGPAPGQRRGQQHGLGHVAHQQSKDGLLPTLAHHTHEAHLPRSAHVGVDVDSDYNYVRRGRCTDGYYAGNTTPSATLDSCAALCLSEPKCRYFALVPGSTCARFDGRADQSPAAPCSGAQEEDGAAPRSTGDHALYKVTRAWRAKEERELQLAFSTWLALWNVSKPVLFLKLTNVISPSVLAIINRVVRALPLRHANGTSNVGTESASAVQRVPAPALQSPPQNFKLGVIFLWRPICMSAVSSNFKRVAKKLAKRLWQQACSTGSTNTSGGPRANATHHGDLQCETKFNRLTSSVLARFMAQADHAMHVKELENLEAAAAAHAWAQAAGVKNIVLNLADLLWRPAQSVERLKGFLPCVAGRGFDTGFVPVLGRDIFPENKFKVHGSIRSCVKAEPTSPVHVHVHVLVVKPNHTGRLHTRQLILPSTL